MLKVKRYFNKLVFRLLLGSGGDDTDESCVIVCYDMLLKFRDGAIAALLCDC